MEQLEKHFDIAFAAPDGIKKLRELILSLAFQGKLVPQDPNDPPTNELLKNIEIEKSQLVKEGKIKVPKPFPPIKPEDVQYQLPKGWEWVSLGNVSEVNGGFAFKSSKYSNDGMRVVRISDFDEKGFKNDKVVRYPFSDDLKNFKLEPQNILMAMTGGTVGKSLLVKELPEPMVVNQRVATIRILPGVVPEYINSLIQTNLIQNVIRNAKNSTNDNISMGDITGFYVPLAPLAEQHRIVAKIDQLMARCEELEKLRNQGEQKRLDVHKAALNSLLSASESDSFSSAWNFITRNFSELYSVKENVAELRKAILQLAVMGKLVPQDPNDQPASELLNEIEAEKKRLVKVGKIKAAKPLPPIKPEEVPYQLPTSWEWVRLGELGDTNIGLTYSPSDVSESGIPVLRSNNIQNGKLDLSDLKRVDMSVKDSVLVHDGDLLICARNGSRALVGKTALISGLSETMAFGAFMAIFRSRVNLYLLHFINSPLFRRVIDEVNTMTINQITQDNLRTTICPLPPLAEQYRIVSKIDKLMAMCDELDKQIEASVQKQTTLLNAVMAQV